MANRPVIKAAQALKTGERWDEVIEYWRVSPHFSTVETPSKMVSSSTPIEVM
jgi:hypothetical protein